MYEELTSIMIKASSYCNLNCPYCFEHRKDKEQNILFPIESAKQVVRFLRQFDLSSEFEIKFTGGEVSLILPHLKLIINELKKLERYKNTHLYFNVVSNGSNMDGLTDMMNKGYLDPNSTKISWDGIHTASKSRFSKDSSEYNDEFFNKNIEKLGKSGYGNKVLLRYAVTKNTIDDMYDSYKYAIENGCTKIEYYFLYLPETKFKYYKDKTLLEKFETQLYKIAELYNKYHFQYENWNSLIYSSFINPNNTFLRDLGCRHLGRMFYIDMLGRLSPCGYFSEDEASNSFRIILGDIYNGLIPEKVEEFRKVFKDFHPCKNKECNLYHCVECPALMNHKASFGEDTMYDMCQIRYIEDKVFKDTSHITSPIIEKVKQKYNITNIGPYTYPK